MKSDRVLKKKKERTERKREMAKSNLREDILTAARELFNKEGYGKVSMRRIAAALGIAIGNLTYYFPKKQIIVDALMEDSFHFVLSPESEDVTLQAFHSLLYRMLTVMEQNAFFFLDDGFDGSKNHEHHLLVRSHLQTLLEKLTQEGYFVPSFDAQTRETVLQMLLMTHLTWLKLHRVGEGGKYSSKEAFLEAHWTILAPYLTKKGKEAVLCLHP